MNRKYLSARPRLADRQPSAVTFQKLRNEEVSPVEFKRKYKDLEDVLSYLRLQVLQSVRYADEVLPHSISNPYQLFDWLKERTKYKNDPKGTELLQRMKTLIEGDFWGSPGMGDCDCFTITVLACCNVLGWPSWIKLAGRDKLGPVHIWSGVNWKGKDIALDLTNKEAGIERDYKYIQKINFVPV